MTSLRARLFVVWALSGLAAVAVGLMLIQLRGQSTDALAARADALATQACERIADRYGFYAAGWAGPTGAGGALDSATRRDLAAVVELALGRPGAAAAGPQGGVWHQGEGIVASLPRADLLGTDERAAIEATSAATIEEDAPQRRLVSGGGGDALLRACPLSGPIAGLAAWVRVGLGQSEGPDPLRVGLGVLFALVLGIAAWLAWLIADWNRKVRGVEAALARHDAPSWPQVAPTGEPSLDRIVVALNLAAQRLAEARADSEAMARRVALSERLAALGRVAAGVAHEIRNPLAAMRLRAENALLGDAARRGAALEAVLAQVARLDRLLGELLAMTQRREPCAETVDVPAFLGRIAAEASEGEGAAIAVETGLRSARFDPALLQRALGNLLGNARRHAGRQGYVVLSAARIEDRLRFVVADSGPGIDPALTGTLFEPFVTGRADGTGLGLAIAREIAEAHGGALVLADPGGAAPSNGAAFALEVPWHAS